MNLDTLNLFCEIVRLQSFSRGGRACGITQSAASQAVSQLEAHLDVILIDRTKRPFALTAEGRTYYEGVRKLLNDYEKVAAEVRSTRTQVGGTVRVAAIYSIGLHVMARHVQQFISKYPQANIRLEYLHPKDVTEAVVAEEADIGLISYPTPSRTLAVVPLRSERMVLVCPPAHALASKKVIEAHDLDEVNFVAFDPDLSIRKAIDRSLRQSKAQPKIVMEFDNIETIKQALEVGTGVAVLPEPTVQKEVNLGSLVAIPLALEELVRPIGIIHRRLKRLTPAVRKFMELLREEGAA
ncbi:MAG: LysR family transcriptional regulator [Planctomycetota bacterium]|nr:LysR family transcriptional regulator [Planctomycetota bacterium]